MVSLAFLHNSSSHLHSWTIPWNSKNLFHSLELRNLFFLLSKEAESDLQRTELWHLIIWFSWTQRENRLDTNTFLTLIIKGKK